MRKAIGSELGVFLKGNESDIPDMYGMLIDVTEDSLYIQGILSDTRVYIIPRDNIYFCTTDTMPATDRILTTTSAPHPQSITPPQNNPTTIYELAVYINDDFLVAIPIPPTFEVSQWHDGIMKVVFGHQDVQAALMGKVQKAINYLPGEVYIIVDETEAVPPPAPSTNASNTFVMGQGGNPSTQFVSPMDMAARLSNSVKRGKNNGDS